MNTENPYKGLFPYTAKDERFFAGRDEEAFQLVEMIKKNQLVVLYGDSGTGKTSLINAKLFPELKRQYYFPIYIRLNYLSEDDPLSQVRGKIYTELKQWDKKVPEFRPNISLVEYAAKASIFNGLVHPILFFDQFEELFTLGPKHVSTQALDAFINQLADLISVKLPRHQKKHRLATTIDEEEVYGTTAMFDAVADDRIEDELMADNILKYTVVFSLRQDYIAQLDDLRFKIPSITTNRFRIKKFNHVQAHDAILKPAEEFAREKGEAALFPVINEEAAQEVVRQLKTLELANDNVAASKGSSETVAIIKDNLRALWPFRKREEEPARHVISRTDLSPDYLNEVQIDPTVLSLYCYQLYEEAKQKSKVKNEPFYQITTSQVRMSPSHAVIKNYYEASLKKGKIRKAIEQFLITPDGRRLLLPLNEFLSGANVTEEEVETLREQTAIIRIYGKGDEREIELAHDQIAKRALISRKERMANRIIRNATFIVLGLVVLSIVGVLYYVGEKEKQVSIKSLQARVSDLNKMASSLEGQNRQQSDSISRLNESLKFSLLSRNTLLTDKEEINKAIALYQRQLKEESNRNAALRGSLAKSQDQISSLTASLAQARQDNEHLRSDNSYWQARSRNSADSLNQVTKSTTQLTADLNSARNRITRLQSESSNWETRYERQSDSLARLTKTVAAQSRELEESRKKINQLQEENTLLRNRLAANEPKSKFNPLDSLKNYKLRQQQQQQQ